MSAPRRRMMMRIGVGLLVCCAVAAVWLIVSRPTDSGLSPADQSEAPISLWADVTAESGIRFQHFNGATGRKLLPETMGSGTAVIDFDGDSWPDLLFVNSCSWPGDPPPGGTLPTLMLYRNQHDGTFDDVTKIVGLDVSLYGMGATVGDYNNDGFADLFVTAVGGNRLFRNDATAGGRRFVDVTSEAKLGEPAWPKLVAATFLQSTEPIAFPSSATWLDYDLDGHLDLFTCYYVRWSPGYDLAVPAKLSNGSRAYVPPTQFPGTLCTLFRNRGDGTFEDVSRQSGVEVLSTNKPTGVGKALGVVALDADDDGYPDLMVACDTVQNFLFHNQPDTDGRRRFVEEGELAGVAYADGRPRGGMGIDAAYLQADQLFAVVANFTNEPNTLLKRTVKKPLRFSDYADTCGIAAPSRAPMKFGALFFDYDLDGRPDLFTANGHLEPDIHAVQSGQMYAQTPQLFWNSGRAESRFALTTSATTGDALQTPLVGRGCATLDYDGDGDLDLVVTANNGPAKLYQNLTPHPDRAIRLELVPPPGCNRSSFGARVILESPLTTQCQYLTAARGYLSQPESISTFGIGTDPGPFRARVWWPTANGEPEIFDAIPPAELTRLIAGKPAQSMRKYRQ